MSFSQLQFWRFIEISVAFSVYLSSIIIFSILIILFSFGKIENDKFSFINNIYPKLNISQKQLFNLSKSSELFEFTPSQFNDYQEHEEIIRSCSGIDKQLCQIIEPIVIDNRNLLFSNFSGVKAYRIKIKNTDLRYSNFNYAQLQGADISKSDLSWSNFRFTILQGADIYNSALNNVIIRETNLSLSSISSSSFKDIQICDSDLSQSYIYNNYLTCNSKPDYRPNLNCTCEVSDFYMNGAILSNNKNMGLNINLIPETSHPVLTLKNNSIDVENLLIDSGDVTKNNERLPVVIISNKNITEKKSNYFEFNKNNKPELNEKLIHDYVKEVVCIKNKPEDFYPLLYAQVDYLTLEYFISKSNNKDINVDQKEYYDKIFNFYKGAICQIKKDCKEGKKSKDKEMCEREVKNTIKNSSKLNLKDKSLLEEKWDSVSVNDCNSKDI